MIEELRVWLLEAPAVWRDGVRAVAEAHGLWVWPMSHPDWLTVSDGRGSFPVRVPLLANAEVVGRKLRQAARQAQADDEFYAHSHAPS